MSELLFDQQFLRKLENMAFLLKKARAGRYSGQHRSPRKGQSVEFADYRAYVTGDDWRQVDWHAYARLERLFIKLFVEENDLLVHLLVDNSASMAWPSGQKFRLAKQLAGALGYLALANMEQAGVVALAEGCGRYLPLQRGLQAVNRFWGFLRPLETGGAVNLNRNLRQAGKFIKGPGLTIIISDLLSPDGYEEGLQYLQHRGQQVLVIQVLDRSEKEPELLGNFRLVDCENGEAKEVSVTPLILKAYREHLQNFLSGVRGFCLVREIAYLEVDAADALEDILLRSLRSGGILV